MTKPLSKRVRHMPPNTLMRKLRRAKHKVDRATGQNSNLMYITRENYNVAFRWVEKRIRDELGVTLIVVER